MIRQETRATLSRHPEVLRRPPAERRLTGSVAPSPFGLDRADEQAGHNHPAPPQTQVGFLVMSGAFDLLYANEAALRILSFPSDSNAPGSVRRRVRAILPQLPGRRRQPLDTTFVSGQRTYVCRQFPLAGAGKTHEETIGLLLERPAVEKRGIADLCERFHFSPRQSEVVYHVVAGLTTKEMAAKMDVSPHTVKQYLRLVMGKLSVTTRAAIAGKIVTG